MRFGLLQHGRAAHQRRRVWRVSPILCEFLPRVLNIWRVAWTSLWGGVYFLELELRVN